MVKHLKAKSSNTGDFMLVTTANNIGTNNVTLSYAGNTKYKATSTKTTFNVTQKTTIITVGSTQTVPVNKQMSIYGKLTDNNGNNLANQTITIKVDGKTYTTNTTQYGNYNIKITPTTTGSKTITVSYAGNNINLACSNSTTFQVKQS